MRPDVTTTMMIDSTGPLRRSVYFLFIAIAFGIMAGHIIAVEGTHGDNDRSRWATIRSLVEQQTYVIGLRTYWDEANHVYEDQGQITQPLWGTIDKVLNPQPGWRNENPQPGEPVYAKYFYSSKPPLLPTVLAGEYWLLNKYLGWTFDPKDDNRRAIVRVILFTINGIPWLIALVLLSKLIDRLGTTDFGRIAAVAAVCFCTFINAFAWTLNNHSVASWSVVFALYPVLNAALRQSRLSFLSALMAGFWASWTVTCELPAAAFAGLLGMWVLVRQPSAILPFLLGAAVPAAGLLVTNYLALGTIIPAYEKFGTEWYNYHGSHWHPENLSGIDKPKDSTLVYLFHNTLGHHGLFSLTPILLLSLVGLVIPQAGAATRLQKRLRTILGWGTLLLSLVILGFYLSKTESYNYGGWTAGPRWFMWLSPLWILGAIPILDTLSISRLGRGLTYLCLCWSAFSVAYPAYSPWRHPWLYRLLEHHKVIEY